MRIPWIIVADQQAKNALSLFVVSASAYQDSCRKFAAFNLAFPTKPLPDNASPAQKMAHTLKSKTGRAIYKVRKQTVEPVFGIIKSAMGFRQFSVRGLDKVEGGMESGLPGVEFEAYGIITSKIWVRQENE